MFDVGRPNPFAGIPCRDCGEPRLKLVWKLEVRPLGTFSLAGAQLKASAREHPYCVCEGCGAESRGRTTSDQGD